VIKLGTESGGYTGRQLVSIASGSPEALMPWLAKQEKLLLAKFLKVSMR
jgi:hypothetical protein